MDNLSVHKSRDVQHVLELLKIRPIYNAPYYPDGNPIEFVFSMVKREYKQRKMHDILNGIETSN